MRELTNLIIDHQSLFYYMNIVEMIVGLIIMVLAPFKKWYGLIDYMIAIYLGIGIGSAVGFEVSFSLAGMLLGICIGIFVAFLLAFVCKDRINYVLFVLMLKLSVVLICNYFSNEPHYSMNTTKLIIIVIVSLIICMGEYILNRTDSIRYLYSKYLYAIFGVLEVSAGIVCWHRYDLSSVIKFLSKVDYYYFFTYLWKVDFSISGQTEDWYVMMFLLLPIQVIYMCLAKKAMNKKL